MKTMRDIFRKEEKERQMREEALHMQRNAETFIHRQEELQMMMHMHMEMQRQQQNNNSFFPGF